MESAKTVANVRMRTDTRTTILRVQIGCKRCKDKSYICYTCRCRAPVSKHLDVMQSKSPNNHIEGEIGSEIMQ